MKLPDILNRRSDLSTFLVHLTRDTQSSARENLESIISDRKIEARSVYGALTQHTHKLPDKGKSQQVVCFTETPLEYTYFLTEQIDDRDYKFSNYGIAITKRLGREKGVNPVWYLDITPGHDWLTTSVDALRKTFIDGGAKDNDLGRLFPYIEQMGNGKSKAGTGYCKEFWWEREWRHCGDFRLPLTVICLCPESEIPHFSALMQKAPLDGKCVDPTWSLERIIAHLAGFAPDEIEILRNT